MRRRDVIVALLAVLLAAAAAYAWRNVVHDGGAAGPALVQRGRAAQGVACPAAAMPPPLVLLVLGQSNAANHGEARAASPHGAAWFDGRCYAIADPLPGGSGDGGSIWSRLAALLAAQQRQPRPLLVAVLAVESTPIAAWVGDGALAPRVQDVALGLRRAGYVVSAVLWQQGEADARTGTSEAAYRERLAALVAGLRTAGIDAPVLVATSTRCRNEGSEAVRRAQAAPNAGDASLRAGPDTDALGDVLRYDGCHFNAAGLDAAARAWLSALAHAGVVEVAATAGGR